MASSTPPLDPFRQHPFLLLSLLVFLTACGESSTAPAGGDEDPSDTDSDLVACEWISLESSSAMPVERIAIGSPPDSFDRPIWVQVRSPDDTTAGYTWMETTESTDSLVAPVHPLGDPGGGPVELSVTDGSVTCEPVDFTVEALPDAPGTLLATVDSLNTLVELQAEILGTTGQELAEASFDTLGIERFPLAIAQAVIAHADNPNSLASLAQGASEEFGDVDLTMADRLLARSGIPGLVSAHLARLRQVHARLPAAPGSEPRAGLGAAPGDSPTDYNCIGITTAFELDFCMNEAREAAQVLDGATGTVLKDAGTAVGVAGLVPHPGVRAGSAVVGAGMWAATTYFEGWSSVLPSELGDLTFDLTKEVFLEDEEGSGQWENAEITAESTGWGLDKAILEGIAQAASLAGPFGELSRRFESTELSLGDLLGFIQSDRVNAAIEAATGGDDFIEIPPEMFGPVPVDDEDWTESSVDGLGVIELTNRTTYEPRESGTGYVILRNVEGTFAGQTASTNKPVEVREITVDIQPDQEVADPGQVFAFDATVENAANPEMLDVTANLGRIINVTYEGDGLHTIEYAAPETSDFHDFITAEHTAETGARAYSSERRLDQADIYSQVELVIDPFATCAEVGEEAPFSAEVPGQDNPVVTWTVVEGVGEIDENGTFVSSETGQATIRATLVSDESVTAEATVTVGGCACWWSVQVTGVPNFGDATMDNGWSLGFTASGSNLFSISGNGSTSGGLTGYFYVYPQDQDVGAPFVPGTFQALTGGAYGTAQSTQFATQEGATSTAFLLEAGPDLLHGSASGTVTVSNYPYDDPNTYSGSFRAAFRITPEIEQDQGGGVTAYFCNSQSGQ